MSMESSENVTISIAHTRALLLNAAFHEDDAFGVFCVIFYIKTLVFQFVEKILGLATSRIGKANDLHKKCVVVSLQLRKNPYKSRYFDFAMCF